MMSDALMRKGLFFAVVMIAGGLNAAPDGDMCKALVRPKSLPPMTLVNELKTPTAGTKGPFTITKGDAELTIGGRIKVENYYEDNAYLLNKNIPDENLYFKETVDLTINGGYGAEKYGYKVVEMFFDFRHKGVWGKGLIYADADSGPIGPSNVKFGEESNVETIFGSHSHTSGKTLLWVKDAWLKFSLNAAFGVLDSKQRHTLQMGWFEFDLGRGIALGSYYGIGKEFLGLYNYVEDKSAPGILLRSVLIPDRLAVDLYYSRFEERGKNLEDTINLEKRYIIGRSSSPWRGCAKDDDLFAARMKWRVIRDCKCGTLELEPYVFYNAASDQKIEKLYAPDAKTNWGSYGLAIDYSYADFECGGEMAFNYGQEELYCIDRNRPRVNNSLQQGSEGYLVEEYSHILNAKPGTAGATRALVTGRLSDPNDIGSRSAAMQPVYENGVQIDKAHGAAIDTPYWNSNDRFRRGFDVDLKGWMAVVDGAYTFKKWDLKMALAYGYASGGPAPRNPDLDGQGCANGCRTRKYNAFVGLHESYCGKRVTSIFILDQRLLMRPTNLVTEGGRVKASKEMTFSDLQLVGAGLTWTPKCCIKDLSLNPNIIWFWKAQEEHAYVQGVLDPVTLTDTGHLSECDMARSFMGTEINLLARCTAIKDLTFFANLAVFIPGGYFADVKGVPLPRDIFGFVIQDDRNDIHDANRFRISDDTAYHMNIGFEYKF